MNKETYRFDPNVDTVLKERQNHGDDVDWAQAMADLLKIHKDIVTKYYEDPEYQEYEVRYCMNCRMILVPTSESWYAERHTDGCV